VNEAKALRVLSCRFAPSGYRLSVLTLLIEPVKDFFYAPVLSEERKLTCTGLRITPAVAERHEQESTVGFLDITPIANYIHAGCPGGVCRWTGSGFCLISEEETEQVGGDKRLFQL
jgi:hypothetical protein